MALVMPVFGFALIFFAALFGKSHHADLNFGELVDTPIAHADAPASCAGSCKGSCGNCGGGACGNGHEGGGCAGSCTSGGCGG